MASHGDGTEAEFATRGRHASIKGGSRAPIVIDMESPARVREAPYRLDLRSAVQRAHAVLHVVLAMALAGAVALPLGPRLTLAGVSVAALGAPSLGPQLKWVGRTEMVAVANVLAGFLAFVVLPEFPLLSFALTLAGLVTAAAVARPVVERAVVVLVLALEIAKLPMVASADFTSSLPFLSDLLRSPMDVIAGSIVQSVGLFAIFAIAHGTAGVLRRTQRALIESEGRHRRLMESLPTAVLVVVDGRVVFANIAAQDMFGDVAVSIEGHFLDEILPEGVIPGLKDAIREVRTSGVAADVDGRPMGDGTEAVHLNAALSALDFDGSSAVMVVVTDISARFAAEQARRQGEARFRTAFLNTATPFVLLNPDASVLDLNDAAVRLFGYPHDEAVGAYWQQFVERGDVAGFKEFAGAASVGILNHLHTEAVLIPRTGNAVRAEVDVTVDRNPEGVLTNFIVQIHDVTARHEAEQALRLNEERYRSLFERSPVALYRTKPDGEIIDVNAALLELMGYASKEELLSRKANQIYVEPGERDRIRDLLERDGVMRGRESQVLRHDGSMIWVRDTARLVELEDQSYFEGSLVDVTARRSADAVLRRAAVQGETVAKLGQFALATAAVDELFAEAARSVATVLDVATAGVLLPASTGSYEAAAIVGWPGESDTLLRDRLDALVGFAAGASRPVVVDPPLDTPSGAPRHSAVGVAIRGADRLLGVLVAMDHTGRPFSPDGLHFLRSVANVLAAALDRHESRTQLEQLVRSKDEFIASISHELRTPLTVVAGMAHELQDQWTQFSEDEIQELISLMVDQSSDMRNLIEDLLVAARADIGRVPVHAVVMDVAPAVAAVLSALPERNGAEIRSDLAPVQALADPTRVRQIVRNLVTNALRYGGRTITVSTGQRSDEVYIRVHDSGPGIQEGQRERIFEPYESVHEAVGTPGSVGLGLTISRKLARLLGGDLTYDVVDGSVFELTLPACADTAMSVTAADQEMETPLSWSSLLS